jgi:Mid2 like cell wall stress sensor
MKFLPLALHASFFARISSADTQGSIQLYSDSDCSTTQGAPISRPHDSCIETNQASSIAAISLPSCSSGQPILYISDENNCNRPTIQPAVQSGILGDCLSFPTGSGIGSAAFICINRVITVSDTQPLASQTAASTTIKPTVSTTTTHEANFWTTSTNAPDQGASHNAQGSSGLSISDKIALGCGLGIGVPALIFGILTWFNAWDQWREQRRHPPLRLIHGEGLPPPPYELHLRQV